MRGRRSLGGRVDLSVSLPGCSCRGFAIAGLADDLRAGRIYLKFNHTTVGARQPRQRPNGAPLVVILGRMRKAIIAAILLFTAAAGRTQAPAAPSPSANQTPSSPHKPATPPPDPGKFWRDATVSLGQPVTIGGQSRFVVTGTGVIVALDAHRGCILTARHMLVDPTTGILTRSLWMRLSMETGDEQPIQLSLFDSVGRNVWQTLPDNDLAVIPLPWIQLTGKHISAVTLDYFVTSPDDLFQGAQVIVLGYPQVFRNPDQTDPYSNVPIARNGTIAWTDPVDPLGKPFLVDANLYGGNSGGPVFRVKNGFDKYGNFNVGGPRLQFIGIVSRGPETPAPVIAGNGIVTHPNPVTGVPDNEYAIVPYVGGIGIIEPASKARELLGRVFANVPPPKVTLPAPQ